MEDLLDHLGHRLQPLLPALLAITLRLLQQATAPVAEQQRQQQEHQQHSCLQGQHGSEQQAPAEEEPAASREGSVPARPEDDRSREIRSSCLKLLAQVGVWALVEVKAAARGEKTINFQSEGLHMCPGFH